MMRVLVTGASGFIGQAVVQELLAAGHQVEALVRTKESAGRLQQMGAAVHLASIEDCRSLRRLADSVEGVIHTAFFHQFSQASLATRCRVLLGGAPSGAMMRFMSAAVNTDRRAIEAFGQVLCQGQRPLVIASPTMAMSAGTLAIETYAADTCAVGGLRAQSELTALSFAELGARVSVIRLPPVVHDEQKQGLVSRLMTIARTKQLSAYMGNGANRWAAVHRLDTAQLFRLALEGGASGRCYHAVAESAIAFRDIAQAIGQHLGLPTQAISDAAGAKHFGWLAPFVATDNPVSSQLTQSQLGWHPSRCTIMDDIELSQP